MMEERRELLTNHEHVLLALLVGPRPASALVERLSRAMRDRRIADVFEALLALRRTRAAEGYDGDAFADLRARLDALSMAIRMVDGAPADRWAAVDTAMDTDLLVRRATGRP